MDEVLEFFKENPTYELATVDAEGNPQVRPFGTMAKIGDALYIQTGKIKNVFKEMAAHPRIAINGLSADGSKWLRINADAVEFDDRAARVEMLEQFPVLKTMYDPDDGNTVVLRLENVKAGFYSFTEAPHFVEF